MQKIQEMLAFNKKFVENKDYEPYITSKYPDKKMAIVSCMDARLTELLPAALGLKNGDVKMIKNAGGMITAPFGSVMRSLLIAVYELDVEEILVIGHYDCGVQRMDSALMMQHMRERGIEQSAIDFIQYCGVDLEQWLTGFSCVEESVRKTVELIKTHPLIPLDVVVEGFVMDPTTGEMNWVPEACKYPPDEKKDGKDGTSVKWVQG